MLKQHCSKHPREGRYYCPDDPTNSVTTSKDNGPLTKSRTNPTRLCLLKVKVENVTKKI